MNYFNKFILYIHKFGIDWKLKKILPSKLYRFIFFIYNYLIFAPAWFKNLVEKNIELKWIWKWKRAFILATWPSINKDNLKVLSNEDCFSVSNFFLHNDINIINPKFHFFAPYHKPLILENYVEWLKQADKILPKNTNIFLWHTTKELVDKYKLFPNRKIFYLYLTPFSYKYNFNITRPVLSPRTWPQMIIPVLMYMWYKEIYLLWCDHNTLKTYWAERKDFYDRDKDVRENAADKNSRMWNIIEFMEAILNTFKQYNIYKKMAEKNKTIIINLSEESWLDVFPKNKLNHIINGKLSYK